MKNPTVKQVNRVIKNLKRIEVDANKEGAFDISEFRVSENLWKCKTVFCVGGWYAISQRNAEKLKPLFESGVCDYDDGADLMSYHLGFQDGYGLQVWAKENREIWDNSEGYEMFAAIEAYNDLKCNSKNPMTIIIAHWEAVRDRLKLIEEKS